VVVTNTKAKGKREAETGETIFDHQAEEEGGDSFLNHQQMAFSV